MDNAQFENLLAQAISARAPLFDPRHQMPCRLFNGFLEGEPLTVLRRGPGGVEPIAVQIGDTQFALRMLEAQCIEVRPV